MPDVIQHYIQGRIVESTSGRSGEVYNPAIGEVIRRVAFASAAEVRQAVEAARDAFPAWAATPPIRRARVMFKMKQLLEDNIDELARLMTEEHGKTVEDA
ncbi:MAG: aldehyde dehydrogenase family protein, partial [Proteobacteria bacterium]|nr:aldehyde dehydrogenase family protein [Pseudomonadota bacterium]